MCISITRKVLAKLFLKSRIFIVCKKVNFSSEIDALTRYVNCGLQTIANILQLIYSQVILNILWKKEIFSCDIFFSF